MELLGYRFRAAVGEQRAACNGGLLMLETLLKSFDVPDEVREFPYRRFEIIHIGDVGLGRAT